MKQYKLLIFGKGGHGAEPHMAIDSTIIASEFVRKSLKYKNKVEMHLMLFLVRLR